MIFKKQPIFFLRRHLVICVSRLGQNQRKCTDDTTYNIEKGSKTTRFQNDIKIFEIAI